MYNILLIDDDVELCRLLKDCLSKENILADIVHSGSDGLKFLLNKEYELIVLDIMLPKMNGFEVLTELRKSTEVPVLMLTARDNEIDKVSGLRLGADDYLTKPFSISEFIARVQSLIRRYTVFNGQRNNFDKVIHLKGFLMDNKDRKLIINDKSIDLTSKEFDVLYLLASKNGKVLTKKQIYNEVWNDEYAFDDSNIMSYMSKLRKKLEIQSGNRNYIQTVWGVGYRFYCKE